MSCDLYLCVCCVAVSELCLCMWCVCGFVLCLYMWLDWVVFVYVSEPLHVCGVNICVCVCFCFHRVVLCCVACCACVCGLVVYCACVSLYVCDFVGDGVVPLCVRVCVCICVSTRWGPTHSTSHPTESQQLSLGPNPSSPEFSLPHSTGGSARGYKTSGLPGPGVQCPPLREKLRPEKQEVHCLRHTV